MHSSALRHPFVYDDYDTVLTNPSLAPPMNARFVVVHNPFRPVVNISYAIDRVVWGYDPFGFHLTNVVLHALVSALVYLLLVRLLADVHARMGQAAPKRAKAGTARFVACAVATIFAVHPLMTEAAGYVSGRSELLCALFFLASIICARAAFLSRAWVPAAGAIVFGGLAVLSKEVAVSLGLAILAYDWFVLPGSRADRMRRLRSIYLPIAAAALTIAAWRVRAFVMGTGATLDSPHLNVLTQAIVIWRYLALIFVPAGQSIMHSVRFVTTAADPVAVAALAALAALAWAAFRVRQRLPLVAVGVFWFFAAVAPSSSVISLREGMAEHRVYVANIGVFIAAASVVAAGIEARRRPGLLRTLAVTGVVAVLSMLTVARYQVWRDPVLLWAEAAERAPGMWEPHYALADALRAAARCPEAIGEYETVIQMRPLHRDAHTNRGICLAQTGRLEESRQAFMRALEIDPHFVRGFTNLGALAITAGDYDAARDMYVKAVEIDNRNVLARMQLARLYEEVFHDYHAAARMCGEARAIQPFTAGVVECMERNRRLAAEKDGGR